MKTLTRPTPRWRAIQTRPEIDRFAEIMRLMDQRYSGLSTEALERWAEGPRTDGRQAELLGWFGPGARTPENLVQVIAVASSIDKQGHRRRLMVAMTGVAADRISGPDCSDDRIRLWLSRFLIGVGQLLGGDGKFRAMRPKTMTWKPIERMHDMLQEGIDIALTGPEGGVLSSRVIQERDIGHGYFWKVSLTRC